ncbi:MAG: penicillin acylase family protein [Candidatus Eremiobacteraeota bacterium]|nr:penicillin acylase family protein [Candidatus Eremiobacteraeota bacterium]
MWFVALLLIVLLGLIAYIALGMRAAAQTSGSISGVGVRAPVQILRDGRDVPHIRAGNLHDLFFTQGYVEASDRLFQIDLTRHFVYGRLTELIGSGALTTDEASRRIDIQTIIAKQWAALSEQDRRPEQAFSDGVNAAIAREPLPIEYRILFTKPQPWTPQDSLAVGFATILGQTESWDQAVNRTVLYKTYGPAVFASLVPLTDPKYDAPTAGGKAAPLPPLASPPALPSVNLGARAAAVRSDPDHPGSNEWVAGAALTATGRALLANDPHLPLAIPGIWYLVDLQAPGYHAAGVSLAGSPGIILGHNDHLAWGITNGTTASYSLYSTLAQPKLIERRERFSVRFGKPVEKTYYGTRDGGFQVLDIHRNPYIVKWQSAMNPRSPVGPFFVLNRAQNIAQAIQAISTLQGPSFNFVFADISGAAAYHLAGTIPNDSAWARYAHDTLQRYSILPFNALPLVAASRSALAFTSNNRMYGSRYPYQLSATFASPYRASRVQSMLRARKSYTIADFAKMQLDTFSIPESELARDIVAAARRRPQLVTQSLQPLITELHSWNGRFEDGSRGATIAWNLRVTAVTALYKAHASSALISPSSVVLLRALRERPRGWVPGNDYDAWLLHELSLAADKAGGSAPLKRSWSRAGAISVEHQLAALGLTFLNGTVLPGDGDAFTVHVQSPGFGQSFRAVWDVGNWDAGGITIPQGESGEPGSGHYTDQAPDWISGELISLPYSRAAVDAAARERLTLVP